MDKLIDKALNKNNIFAVVGASENPQKYGHKVFKALKAFDYKAYPVNPNSKEVLGEKTYDTIADLPEKPDVVSVVVPPKVSEEIVKQVNKEKVEKVWFQPGAESENAINYCKEENIRVVHNKCVLIELSRN